MTIPPSILAIARNLKTQDNRITDLPIFLVQQKRRIWTEDDSEGYVWMNEDFDEAGDDKVRELDELDESGAEIPKGYFKAHYVHVWETSQPFLTEQGAKDYIAINGHNLKESRIYVDSGWRNEEWRMVRDFLMTLDNVTTDKNT